MRSVRNAAVPAALMLCAFATSARADERKFTYSYESKVLPQGAWEFEQWVTLRTRVESGHVQFWQFREEIEYGLTDRLTTALYLNWEYGAIRGKAERHFVSFTSESPFPEPLRSRLIAFVDGLRFARCVGVKCVRIEDNDESPA